MKQIISECGYNDVLQPNALLPLSPAELFKETENYTLLPPLPQCWYDLFQGRLDAPLCSVTAML